MSPRRKKTKETLSLHADPRRIRRTWKINPKSRVKTSDRRKKIERLRDREMRESR